MLRPNLGYSMKLKTSLLLGLSVLLIITNAVTFSLWRPWQNNSNTGRKITVTGEATVKSQPDEYQFSPYYERSTNNEIVLLSQDIVAKLKAMGINENQIKVTVSNYGLSPNSSSSSVVPEQSQSTLNISLTVNDKAKTQKVQDYLITTNSKGLVSPNSAFSTSRQKLLKDQARTQAIADARKKADSSATALGSRIDKVIEITDRDSNSSIKPIDAVSSNGSQDISDTKSLPIQPGQNEISYSVQVTFSLR